MCAGLVRRFQHGLGMTLVEKSDLSTGNTMFASYVLKSNDIVFVFTAPYSRVAWKHAGQASQTPVPFYDQDQAHEFISCHGMAVRSVGERTSRQASAVLACNEDIVHAGCRRPA